MNIAITSVRVCLSGIALGVGSVGAHPVFLTGEIGTAPVFATIERAKGEVSGWYLYSRYAKQIRLQGTVDAEGNFQLEEFQDPDNKKTGILTGTMIGTHWTGEWRNATAAKPLAFSFDENHDGLNALTVKLKCTARLADRQFGFTYAYDFNLAVAHGRVKKLSISREVTSKDGDDQSCSIGLSDLKQVPSETGLLLRDADREDSSSSCSVRIIGAGKYLYVMLGDTSETNNDCRSAADTMFCSPRAFWTDLVVDRETSTCRQVQ